MPGNSLDETRDYIFADKALAARERAGLTQLALATLLGVSGRTIQAWEAGLSYPGSERLKQLIAFYLARGTLAVGREEEAAVGLWEAARAHAPRRTIPFDRNWFASLRDATMLSAPPPLVSAAAAPRRDDWGEAPAVGTFHGRAVETATLSRWLVEDRCRLVGMLGMGGVGKTLLAARLVREAAPRFAMVYWRSLRNAPPVEEWLAGAIVALSSAQTFPPPGFAARLALLLELLQTQRGLLVLDNLETILEPGASAARYREGYGGYGEVLRRLGEYPHQGCLLLTGREAPPELALLTREQAPVRTLRLEGLGPVAGRAILQNKGLVGDDVAWRTLVAHYSGNPLALNVVGETLGVVFGGDIAAFLAQDADVFGDIRELLDEQINRLSTLERSIAVWLAVEREPIGFRELVADLGPEVVRGDVMEAVEALQRRSLLERGEHGAFTLQPVVLEYMSTRLVDTLASEILASAPVLLVTQALLKAQAKDYVRRSQERLIARPLLERLSALSGAEGVEQRLLRLLHTWRGQSPAVQGYGPGNVVNLLRLLRGRLSGLDLSGLALRHVYLQGIEARDTSLVGAHLSEAVLAEPYNYTTSVALSADGAYLAAGTDTGQVCLWRVADRTLLLAVQGHSGPIPGVALSRDGRLLASASFDGTVKLWEATAEGGPPGRLLATLQGHTRGVWGVALSADGLRVAGGSYDGTVMVWETTPESGPSGRLQATLRGHTGGVLGVALSADGRLVAGAGFDGTVNLWEAPPGAEVVDMPVATLEGHVGGARAVALSADGMLVISAGFDDLVKLWETTPVRGSPWRPRATLAGHTSGVWSVALSADGRLAASGSQDGTVKLWDATPQGESSGRLLATLQGHTSGIEGVALSGDGRLVASGSQDGTIKLWEAAGASSTSVRLLATLQGHISAVWGVALSEDKRLVAGGSFDGMVKLWEASSGRLLAIMQGHTSAVRTVALSADGRLVASAGFDGTIKLWDASPERGYSGGLLTTLRGHSGGVLGLALSADGHLVASGSFDGTVKLWDASPTSGSLGALLATLQGHTSGIHSVALSVDGRLVASAGFDGTVKLWDATFPSGSQGRLRATLEGHGSSVYSVALSADGRLVASGSQDGVVKLWEASASGSSGELLATLKGHTGAVWGVALSADGDVMASGSYDGTIKLWDTGSGQLVETFQGEISGVWCVALSRDGRLVAGGYDGAINLWDITSASGRSAPSGDARPRTLRGDRLYERMTITALTGVTAAQRTALIAFGAVE